MNRWLNWSVIFCFGRPAHVNHFSFFCISLKLADFVYASLVCVEWVSLQFVDVIHHIKSKKQPPSHAYAKRFDFIFFLNSISTWNIYRFESHHRSKDRITLNVSLFHANIFSVFVCIIFCCISTKITIICVCEEDKASHLRCVRMSIRLPISFFLHAHYQQYNNFSLLSVCFERVCIVFVVVGVDPCGSVEALEIYIN